MLLPENYGLDARAGSRLQDGAAWVNVRAYIGFRGVTYHNTYTRKPPASVTPMKSDWSYSAGPAFLIKRTERFNHALRVYAASVWPFALEAR